MFWYGQFKSGFFEEWRRVGLPSAEHYESAYTSALRAIQFKHHPKHTSVPPDDPLNPAILNAVYGFGVLYGTICGSLLGLSPQVSEKRSEWCGRFNLGISLFDYLSDESKRAAFIVQLPAFAPFFEPISSACQTLHPLNPTEALLNRVATDVMTELEEVIGDSKTLRQRSSLWLVLQEMFRAELNSVNSPLQPNADPVQIRKALRLKSREPFRVMAEWMAHGSTRANKKTLLTQARKLGRALGQCYWLIDDAKDVWDDLNTSRWNLFLIHAMTVEPRLCAQERDPIVDLRLIQIWDRDGVIKRLSRFAVRQLVKSTTPLYPFMSKREEALGFIAASLARW